MKPGPKLTHQDSDYATNYVQEYVNCGKPNCRKCTDGKPAHGPYWYSYHYSPTLKRYVKKYIGKNKPEQLDQAERRQLPKDQLQPDFPG